MEFGRPGQQAGGGNKEHQRFKDHEAEMVERKRKIDPMSRTLYDDVELLNESHPQAASTWGVIYWDLPPSRAVEIAQQCGWTGNAQGDRWSLIDQQTRAWGLYSKAKQREISRRHNRERAKRARPERGDGYKRFLDLIAKGRS